MEQQQNILRNIWRADIYATLALGFDFPNRSNLETMRAVARDTLGTVFTSAELGILLEKLTREFCSYEELEPVYHRLFSTQMLCLPFEASYHLVERGAVLADITGFYQAFAQKPVAGQGPPDAIKMELGFMSVLCLKEAQAEQESLHQERLITSDAERKFLEDHLGRWTQAFSDRLLLVATHDFYQLIANLLKEWLKLECERFKITPDLLRYPQPHETERSVACCGQTAMGRPV